MLLHFCPVGVTLSWEEAHPGARASRPHKSSRSFGHLLHRNQPAAAPCLCFGRAHAVPAGRAVGRNIAGKLSGNRRDSMRAGRPRSRVGRPDGEVEGIRRATSLKAGLSPYLSWQSSRCLPTSAKGTTTKSTKGTKWDSRLVYGCFCASCGHSGTEPTCPFSRPIKPLTVEFCNSHKTNFLISSLADPKLISMASR